MDRSSIETDAFAFVVGGKNKKNVSVYQRGGICTFRRHRNQTQVKCDRQSIRTQPVVNARVLVHISQLGTTICSSIELVCAICKLSDV